MERKEVREIYSLTHQRIMDELHDTITRIDIINPDGKMGQYSFSDMKYWGKASNKNLLRHNPKKVLVFEK